MTLIDGGVCDIQLYVCGLDIIESYKGAWQVGCTPFLCRFGGSARTRCMHSGACFVDMCLCYVPVLKLQCLRSCCHFNLQMVAIVLNNCNFNYMPSIKLKAVDKAVLKSSQAGDVLVDGTHYSNFVSCSLGSVLLVPCRIAMCA